MTMNESTKANARQVGGDHYKNLGVEPWSVIDTWPTGYAIGFYRGNALKYLMRMGNKRDNDLLSDARKAEHYMQKLVELLEDMKDAASHG